jgi:hypothetical protein
MYRFLFNCLSNISTALCKYIGVRIGNRGRYRRFFKHFSVPITDPDPEQTENGVEYFGRLTVPAVFVIVLFAVAVLLDSCTPGPVAGTETGNPDITACLESALSLFDTTDRWIPSSYLIDGERQLSPDNVYNPPIVSNIAKRKGTDTVGEVPDGALVHYDTVIIVDTTFRYDMLVLETVTIDTVHQYFEEGDTQIVGELVSQQLLHDTVFVTDTVVVQDTFLIPSVDTACETSTPGQNNTTTNIDITGKSADTSLSYQVARNPVTGEVVLTSNWGATSGNNSNQPSFKVSSDTSMEMIARNIRIAGVTVDEVYRDADGDGIISTAGNGMSPLLSWTGVYSSCAFHVEIATDFDAGDDRVFPTGTDNRIHSLIRSTMKIDGSTELVRYGDRYFGQSGDTCVLSREVDFPWDSTARIVNHYICLKGMDPFDHRLNQLLSCQQTTGFRSGGIRTMELTVIPETAVQAGTTPETGMLTASIDFGKGLTGRIDAKANYTERTIIGIYAQAGEEYSLFYHRNDTTVELVPLQ